MTAPKKKADSSADRKRVRALLKAVADNPEGGTLLQIAKDKNIRIVMSDRPAKQGAVGLFNGDAKRIDLQRGAKDDTLVGVLAHELRHMWQSKRTNLDTDGLSARDALVHRRVVEGDAFAYQIRFEINQRQDELDGLRKALADIPDRKQAASALKEFNKVCQKAEMKAFFLTMQEDMAAYDKQTLDLLRLKLKLSQLYIKQGKLIDQVPSKSPKLQKERRKVDGELKKIFNSVAKPRPLPDSLLDIAREGLAKDSPKYLRHKDVQSLAAYVRKQIPAKTLARAEALEQKIIATISKAGKAP
ncbi:MAG: DUF6782 family putative metallopeptidase [Alphaproteobacteria bacterium]